MIDYRKIMDIVKAAGNSLLLVSDAERCVTSKEGRANLVTKYDVATQQFLNEKLLEILPEAVFVGEEGDQSKDPSNGYAFIVDPIDGTTNFIKNYRRSCVSVGLAFKGEIIFGTVYNPYSGELFHAVKGEGAFCNDKPIHVSECGLEDGLVLFGTSPYYPHLFDDTYELVKVLHKASLDVRRSGSAALDLCDIASGRADLYFELFLSPWDYAAGSIIVSEAGGKVTKLNGKTLVFDHGCSMLAANPKAYETYFDLEGHIEMD